MKTTTPRRRWQAERAEGSTERAMTIPQNGGPDFPSDPTPIPSVLVEDDAVADEGITGGECIGNVPGTNGGGQ